MERSELIDALERATGADRRLDVLLAGHYYPGDRDMEKAAREGRWKPTASIDAALTLVPSGKGHDPWWMLKAAWRGKAKAEVWVDGKGRPFRGEAATPALAICIAALRALRHD